MTNRQLQQELRKVWAKIRDLEHSARELGVTLTPSNPYPDDLAGLVDVLRAARIKRLQCRYAMRLEEAFTLEQEVRDLNY